jgi:uncharacterized protein
MKNLVKRKIAIEDVIQSGKVLIIYGPRQVGKTTIITSFLEQFKGKYRTYTGDSITTQEIFSSQRLEKLKEHVEDLDLLFIDEAQNIKNIGINLKIIIDAYPNLIIVVTGSSSFELAGQVGEPLMGRNILLNLYPLTDSEIRASEYFDPTTHLDYLMRFGSYPEVILKVTVEEKIAKIKNLTESFLLKDILKFENLKKPEILLNLLRTLAYQIGSEISIHKISKELGVSSKTVERYIDLLEQSFVVFRLKSYNNNLRTEIRKKSKLYFYDLGIRNAIINDFTETNIGTNGLARRDLGNLFENFMIAEKLKSNAYAGKFYQTFFWRNTEGKEIDYIEKWNENADVYEFTLSNVQKKKKPKVFIETNKNLQINFNVVTVDTYRDFLGK